MNKKVLNTISLILFIIGILLMNFPSSLSRFSSSVKGDAIGSIAFYIVDLKYQTAEINLDKITPSDDPYIYTFSVSNYNDTKRLETNAEYNVIIRTTTNLNLYYKLYKNDIEEDILIEKDLVPDSDGTYFNIMKTDKEKFGFNKNEMNEYKLLIYFPKEYISFDYQDIIESIEIIITSSQVID